MICGLHCAIHWAYMVKIHSTGKGKDLPREAGKWLEPTSKRVFITNINFVQQLCLSTIARKIHSIKVPNLTALMHQTINSPPFSTYNAQWLLRKMLPEMYNLFSKPVKFGLLLICSNKQTADSCYWFLYRYQHRQDQFGFMASLSLLNH